MNSIYEMLLERNADGVDFVPILTPKNKPSKIYMTLTKEDFENGKNRWIPKTAYRFWVMDNGVKRYL